MLLEELRSSTLNLCLWPISQFAMVAGRLQNDSCFSPDSGPSPRTQWQLRLHMRRPANYQANELTSAAEGREVT